MLAIPAQFCKEITYIMCDLCATSSRYFRATGRIGILNSEAQFFRNELAVFLHCFFTDDYQCGVVRDFLHGVAKFWP